MRYKLDVFLDAYDAFDKYGFGDGDHPLANDARYRVQVVLEDLGWNYVEANSIHNNHLIELTGPSGERYELEWTYNLQGTDIRGEMLKRGFPSELIKALDELNEQVVDSIEPY